MSQRDQVLQALRQAGTNGVSNGYLNRLGIYRYSARVHELRRDGFEIRTVNGRDGLCTFYLTSEPSPPEPVSPSPPRKEDGEQAQLFQLPTRRPAHPLLDPEAA